MSDIKCAFCESPVIFSEYEEIFSAVKLYSSACTGCGATFPGSTPSRGRGLKRAATR